MKKILSFVLLLFLSFEIVMPNYGFYFNDKLNSYIAYRENSKIALVTNFNDKNLMKEIIEKFSQKREIVSVTQDEQILKILVDKIQKLMFFCSFGLNIVIEDIARTIEPLLNLIEDLDKDDLIISVSKKMQLGFASNGINFINTYVLSNFLIFLKEQRDFYRRTQSIAINKIQELNIEQLVLLKSVFPKNYERMIKKYYELNQKELNRKIIYFFYKPWVDLTKEERLKLAQNFNDNDVLKLLFNNPKIFHVLRESNTSEDKFEEFIDEFLQFKFEELLEENLITDDIQEIFDKRSKEHSISFLEEEYIETMNINIERLFKKNVCGKIMMQYFFRKKFPNGFDFTSMEILYFSEGATKVTLLIKIFNKTQFEKFVFKFLKFPKNKWARKDIITEVKTCKQLQGTNLVPEYISHGHIYEIQSFENGKSIKRINYEFSKILNKSLNNLSIAKEISEKRKIIGKLLIQNIVKIFVESMYVDVDGSLKGRFVGDINLENYIYDQNKNSIICIDLGLSDNVNLTNMVCENDRSLFIMRSVFQNNGFICKSEFFEICFREFLDSIASLKISKKEKSELMIKFNNELLHLSASSKSVTDEFANIFNNFIKKYKGKDLEVLKNCYKFMLPDSRRIIFVLGVNSKKQQILTKDEVGFVEYYFQKAKYNIFAKYNNFFEMKRGVLVVQAVDINKEIFATKEDQKITLESLLLNNLNKEDFLFCLLNILLPRELKNISELLINLRERDLQKTNNFSLLLYKRIMNAA